MTAPKYSSGTIIEISAAVVSAADSIVATGASGKIDISFLPASILTAAVPFIADGGGAALTTGMKGYIEVPFNCTIEEATLLADTSGSIVVDIFKCTYAQFDAGVTHPVSADKITASSPPTISSGTKYQDSTLSGWTRTITAGDILGININSVTSITRVTLSLEVSKL